MSAAEPDDLPETKTRRVGCPAGCLAAITVFVLLIALSAVAIPYALRWKIRGKMDPAELAVLDVLQKVPVQFPAEWADAKPYPTAVESAAEKFLQQYARDTRTLVVSLGETGISTAFERLHRGQVISPEAWTSLSQIANDTSISLEHLRNLCALPNYDMAAMQADPGKHMFWQQFTAKAACARAYCLHRDGNSTEALQWAELPLQACRLNGRPCTTMQMFPSRGARTFAVQTLGALLKSTSSTEVLAAKLGMLNALREDFTSWPLELQLASDPLANMRDMKRDGYDVPLQPGRSGDFYLLENWRAKIEYPNWMLGRLPLGDPRIPRMQTMAEQNFMQSSWISPRAGLAIMHYLVPDFTGFMVTGTFSSNDTQISLCRTIANFDLLRLWLANRLTGEKADTNVAKVYALLPDAKPTGLRDPFSAVGDTYKYDAVRKQFYSVGQDGRDNHAENKFAADYIGDDITMPLLPTKDTGSSSTGAVRRGRI